MFNLDQAIAEWRRQMRAGGIKPPEVLDELECHLREDVRTIVSDGTPEAEAFRLAVPRLGDTDPVSAEFNKLRTTSSVPLRISVSLWAGISTAVAIGLLIAGSPGRRSLLLIAHIFSLTAGYSAAFLTGGFGIYYVCCRWCRALSPARQQALNRAVSLFSGLSVGFVVVGLLLGMFWCGQNRGSFLAGGPREIGTVCASVWLIAFGLIRRFGRVSTRVTMLLCLSGNLIISLAWFGAGIMGHGNGIENYWPLEAVLGVHLFFLTMGVVPTPETAAV